MAVEDPAATARFLGAYCKQFNAGAFAHPTGKELAAHPEWITDEQIGDERAVVISRVLSRDSVRTDFTGRKFAIPASQRIATLVAHTPNLLPQLNRYAYIMTYAEDRQLNALCATLGRRIVGTRITAAAEIIHCWGPPTDQAHYAAWDRATVTEVGHTDPATVFGFVTEAAAATGWDDDYPYYSDGGWSAVCLKGFWPDDPSRGVKPSEMPKPWKAEHRSDLTRTAQWTTLARRTPSLTAFVESVPWWRRTERVRLLKMKAGSRLARHSDITDRDSGTRDGQIVRFHIPLLTHPDCLLHTWDLDGLRRDHHLQAGRWYYLDARKPHAVTNRGPVDRIHLVVDVLCDVDVRRHIAQARQCV